MEVDVFDGSGVLPLSVVLLAIEVLPVLPV